jgi:hypothetical protein
MSDTDQPTMFTDKNVSIQVPHQKVTWFNILGWERDMNANQGGWNFKDNDYWIKRGLDWMFDASQTEGNNSPIAQWTTASMKQSVKPEPRQKGFRLLRHPDTNGDHSNLHRGSEGNPLANKIENIQSASENQLNWSCYLNEPKNNTVWAYEIPLAAEKSGQLRMDLFHISTGPNGKVIEIIELKDADGKDSPLMALVESICYLCQLTRCWKALRADTKEDSLKDLSLQDCEIQLILAAPNEYWENACGRAKRFEDEHFKKMKKIVEVVGNSLKVKPQLFIADVKLTEDGLCELEMREGLSNPPKPNSSILV